MLTFYSKHIDHHIVKGFNLTIFFIIFTYENRKTVYIFKIVIIRNRRLMLTYI